MKLMLPKIAKRLARFNNIQWDKSIKHFIFLLLPISTLMSAHAKHNLINTDQKEEKDQNQIWSIDNGHLSRHQEELSSY